MNRFREFRESRRHTQEEIAAMLKTTQQTIARWESGKAEPSISALRDLAVIYGTSVDDLLGKNPIATSAVTNSYFSLDEGDEHFWGHFGVLLPGDKFTRWFPITLKEANKISTAMATFDAAEPWITVATLNNRMLLLQVPELHRIYLLDDNADEVPGDWELGWDSYNGHTPEVYRALADRYSAVDELEASDTFKEGLDALVEEEGLTDDLIQERVIETALHFKDGSVQRCTPDEGKLWGALYEAEHFATGVFDLSEPDSGLNVYVPARSVWMIDMPLYQVIDGAKKEQEENDRAEALQHAEAALQKAKETTKRGRGRPRLK